MSLVYILKRPSRALSVSICFSGTGGPQKAMEKAEIGTAARIHSFTTQKEGSIVKYTYKYRAVADSP